MRATTLTERAAADCVARAVRGFAVHAMRESPDADLVHEDGHHVGLEVVRVIDQDYLDAQKRIAAAAHTLETAMHKAGVLTHVTVYFDLSEMLPRGDAAAHRAWLRALPARVIQHVRQSARGRAERGVLSADGIARVAALEWEPNASPSVGRGWSSTAPPGGTLVDRLLAKKHARLINYRRNTADHFREHWLAIASLGPGTPEDGGFEMLLQRRYRTDFDRVFLIMRGSNGSFTGAKDVTPEVDPRATPS